jgi:hypothetical protein
MARGGRGGEVAAAVAQPQRLSLKEQYRNAQQLRQEHQMHHLNQLAMSSQQQQHPQPLAPNNDPNPALGIVANNSHEAKLRWAERKAEQLRLR